MVRMEHVENLFLSTYQYNKFVQHQDAVEKKYGVSLNLPTVQPLDIFTTDIITVWISGSQKCVEAAVEQLKKLIAPEKKICFTYPKKLECVFKNNVWLRILAKIYPVDFEILTNNISIAGSTSDVKQISSVMNELIRCFSASKCQSALNNDSNSGKLEIPDDLKVPRNVQYSFQKVQFLPFAVKQVLLSWMKKAFNYQETSMANDSVMILDDTPDQSVIILDSPVTEDPPVVIISDEENEDQQEENNRKTKKRKSDCQERNKLLNCPGDLVVRTRKRRKLFRNKNTEENAAQSSLDNVMENLQIQNNQETASQTSLANIVRNLEMQNNQASTSKAVTGPRIEFIPLDSDSESDNNTLEEVENLPPTVPFASRVKRPVIIDGSNVAMTHGKKDNVFSCKGIKLCIEYFANRGHENVVAFVPQYRRNKLTKPPTVDQDILEDLATKQLVVFTPSRRVNGKSVSSYDDRFILKLATTNGGVILSNDNYRDLMKENEDWKKTVDQRLLMYCFVGDILMIPDDPLGKDGPSLDELLTFPPSNDLQ